MSTYADMLAKVQKMERQKKMGANGRVLLVIGVLILLAIVFITVFISRNKQSSSWLFLAGFGAFIFILIGVTNVRAVRGDFSERLEQAQMQLATLTEERERYLDAIARGNMEILGKLQDYVLYNQQTRLMPTDLLFNPQKGEVCYLQIQNVPLNRPQGSEMKRLDMGTLAVTDRRLICLGQERKLTHKFDKILEVRAYKNTLHVTKDGRKTPDIFTGVDGELLGSVLKGVS